jgi:hypothetical protein
MSDAPSYGRSKRSIDERRAFGIGCKYDGLSRLQLERIAYERDTLRDQKAKLVAELKAARAVIDANNNGAETFRASAKIGIVLRELGEIS